MPAISRTTRPLALALVSLGLAATAMSAPPADAASGDELTTTTTGFPVPRTSGAQAGFTRRIAKSNMRSGDLMFFYGSGGVYHAAIFLGWSEGHATMVHSPGSGQRVRVAVPWTSRWFLGTLRR